MFVMRNLDINGDGNLTIAGQDTVGLAQEYGTPLYVVDEDEIIRNCTRYQQSVNTYYEGNGLVLYASKALCTVAMCKLMDELGMGLDVASGGEIYTAVKADFPMERVYFHGNNKSRSELELALESGVGYIVVDNAHELEMLSGLAADAGRTANILFRIKPGIDAHTHEFIRTGQIDSKYGVALENGEAEQLVRLASGMGNIRLCGIHCHIGSQICDIEPFELAAKVMLDFAADMKDRYGVEFPQLNLGGGFGIPYTDEDSFAEYDAYMKNVSAVVARECAARGLTQPFILLEPGRSIAGPAGITLYEVGAVKEIEGIRTYVAVDGGMNDNPRYALYKAQYDFMIANRASEPKDRIVTIAGRYCETGDLLGEHVRLQAAEPGDILAVQCTGAYNYSMSSNYNRAPRPAMAALRGGGSRIVVKREDYDDIIRNDME